jgi:hypothetical protein
MKLTSLSERILHACSQLSWCCIGSVLALYFVANINPVCIFLLVLSFSFLGSHYAIKSIMPARISPDWVLVYPELEESCYSPVKISIRLCMFLGNIGIAAAISGVVLLFEEFTFTGALLLISGSTSYAIYAILESFQVYRDDYHWENVYPELTVGNESNIKNHKYLKTKPYETRK